MIDLGLWQGHINPVVQSQQQRRAGVRRKRS